MTRTIRTSGAAVLAATLAAALVSLPQASFAAGVSPAPGAASQVEQSTPAASDAAARLDKKQYQNVKVTVDANGIATLTGTVDLYEYKVDADKRIHKAKGVKAVRNDIQVAGPSVPDQELKDKLVEKLQYDQVGYGNEFNAINIDVQNGVAILAGHALNYPARDSALGLVSTYPGVKDVVDDIQVDPVSFQDDRIRVQVARAVYGFPALNQYAIDPAKPIRIVVMNGHVELDGIVLNQGDKEMAFIRANGVPGVFSVKNNLQVANQPSESQKTANP
jgi:osmotically-inducible protein OsmY